MPIRFQKIIVPRAKVRVVVNNPAREGGIVAVFLRAFQEALL
jgi:hypothetical protein